MHRVGRSSEQNSSALHDVLMEYLPQLVMLHYL
jgi:hypothetical protein